MLNHLTILLLTYKTTLKRTLLSYLQHLVFFFSYYITVCFLVVLGSVLYRHLVSFCTINPSGMKLKNQLHERND